MTTSAGLSCEASENAMVCEMQPKCIEMRLRCDGRGVDDVLADIVLHYMTLGDGAPVTPHS